MRITHLYVGDAEFTPDGTERRSSAGLLVRAFCGWPNVAIRHTTSDLRQVTCNACLGRMRGNAILALKEAEATKEPKV
jgi:hypothetical protein